VPVQKIGDVIANSGNLQTLTRKARRLKDLQLQLFEASPPLLAAASRVVDLRSGTLVVVADNSAVAAKLRQLAPRLLSRIREQADEVTGIRIEVQVKPHKIKAEEEFTPHPLPPDAIQEFERLSGSLPPSPLKSALARLVANRRGRKRRET
jgi:hypothetical protein